MAELGGFLSAALLALESHLTLTGISLIGLAGLAVYTTAKGREKTGPFPERKLLLFIFALPLFLFQYLDIPGFSLLPVVWGLPNVALAAVAGIVFGQGDQKFRRMREEKVTAQKFSG